MCQCLKCALNDIRDKKLQLMGEIGVLLTNFSDETGVEITDIRIDDFAKKISEKIPLRYFVNVEIKI